MSQKNETTVLVLALLITAALLGGGFWWFTRSSNLNMGGVNKDDNNSTQSETPQDQNQPNQSSSTSFAPPKSVPSGTTVRIEGATSLVQINQALKNGFEGQFPGTSVNTQAGERKKGFRNCWLGMLRLPPSLAHSPPRKSPRFGSHAVAKDAIAIVVGNQNPFRKGLTSTQVVGIFQGQITDWSRVGGTGGTIRVITDPRIAVLIRYFKNWC
jgi:phosphate transport system substrate-binding protein